MSKITQAVAIDIALAKLVASNANARLKAGVSSQGGWRSGRGGEPRSGAEDALAGAGMGTDAASSTPIEEEAETSPKLSGLMVVELSAHRAERFASGSASPL
jgi:hypothetical protein